EGDLPVAISMHDGKVTLLQCDGNFSFEEVRETIEMAETACETIHEMQRDALTRKYLKIQEEAQKESDALGSDTSEEETADSVPEANSAGD
ncbi:MAG: hypothetical protein ACFFB3_10115, partial [Candidatus Hodarchaeota archaeon]